MVSDCVTVVSRAYGSDEAWKWTSRGAEGYTMEPCEKEGHGTEIVLNIKPNTEENNYDEFLDTYTIKNLVKKYSDSVSYTHLSFTITALRWSWGCPPIWSINSITQKEY